MARGGSDAFPLVDARIIPRSVDAPKFKASTVETCFFFFLSDNGG